MEVRPICSLRTKILQGMEPPNPKVGICEEARGAHGSGISVSDLQISRLFVTESKK